MDYSDIKKILFKLEPEISHKLAEFAMRSSNLFPGILSFIAKDYVFNDSILHQEILNNKFYNPVGLAGGFDKNATMIAPLCSFGFGFLEYGTFTPLSQSGNEKPRVFRYPEVESIQNAMGFNNDGAAKIKQRVSKLYPFCIPLIANIGKNKATSNENAINDYLNLIDEFKELCDIFVVNISSPNTVNLRDLQEKSFISSLFDKAKNLTNKPILIKISPDLQKDIAIELCLHAINCGVSGIIINNTSIDYSLYEDAKDFGGLSGAVIKEKSREFFKAIASELFGKTILISSGGIDSANEAYERVKDGANLVEIYTSFIFKGPRICKDINEGLSTLLKEDGFTNIKDAVGINLKNSLKKELADNLSSHLKTEQNKTNDSNSNVENKKISDKTEEKNSELSNKKIDNNKSLNKSEDMKKDLKIDKKDSLDIKNGKDLDINKDSQKKNNSQKRNNEKNSHIKNTKNSKKDK